MYISVINEGVRAGCTHTAQHKSKSNHRTDESVPSRRAPQQDHFAEPALSGGEAEGSDSAHNPIPRAPLHARPELLQSPKLYRWKYTVANLMRSGDEVPGTQEVTKQARSIIGNANQLT